MLVLRGRQQLSFLPPREVPGASATIPLRGFRAVQDFQGIADRVLVRLADVLECLRDKWDTYRNLISAYPNSGYGMCPIKFIYPNLSIPKFIPIVSASVTEDTSS